MVYYKSNRVPLAKMKSAPVRDGDLIEKCARFEGMKMRKLARRFERRFERALLTMSAVTITSRYGPNFPR